MGDTNTHAHQGMDEMERRAGRDQPDPPSSAATSSRRSRRQDPVYQELSQVRGRIMELMGETVTPALRAAESYASDGATRARQLTQEQPLTALAIVGGIGFLLGLVVAHAGEGIARG
jgi:ElaB/YqjD/DUF883 family membrane-anchored ribosome-binding protein